MPAVRVTPGGRKPMLVDQENELLVRVLMAIAQDKNVQDKNVQGRIVRVQEAIGPIANEAAEKSLAGHGEGTVAVLDLGPQVHLVDFPPITEASDFTEIGPDLRGLLIDLLIGVLALIETIEVYARKSLGVAVDALMGPNVQPGLPAPVGMNGRQLETWGAVTEMVAVLTRRRRRKRGRKFARNARNAPGVARNSTGVSEPIARVTVKVVPGAGMTVRNARIDRIAVLHGSVPQRIRAETLVTIARAVFNRQLDRSRNVTGRSPRKDVAHVSEY
jgi:hypothetical protein